MPDKDLRFEDFLKSVNPIYQAFVTQTHDTLLQNGCKLKLQLAKNGYVVSYAHGTKKRVLLNFVFRKNGLVTRLYGDFVGEYQELLQTLPEKMKKSIEKAPVCKLCNDRCGKGYAFSLGDAEHLKCRYNCFLFAVDEESVPFITALLEQEMRKRSA